jgi:hypothetical protein
MRAFRHTLLNRMSTRRERRVGAEAWVSFVAAVRSGELGGG